MSRAVQKRLGALLLVACLICNLFVGMPVSAAATEPDPETRDYTEIVESEMPEEPVQEELNPVIPEEEQEPELPEEEPVLSGILQEWNEPVVLLDEIQIGSAEDLIALTEMDFATTSEATITLTADINMSGRMPLRPLAAIPHLSTAPLTARAMSSRT